jgi:hypothetical protein
MNLRAILCLAALAAPAVVAACGGGQSESAAPATPSASASASAAPSAMGALFHEFDAKRYDEPKCVLCHGAGANDGSFKMPNPELPKLDLTPGGFKKLQAKKPKVMEFMLKKVEPQMASLLGEPAFDPKTKTGFGCTGCHTTVEKGAAPAAAPGGAKPAPKP